jgi:hypothetical protein
VNCTEIVKSQNKAYLVYLYCTIILLYDIFISYRFSLSFRQRSFNRGPKHQSTTWPKKDITYYHMGRSLRETGQTSFRLGLKNVAIITLEQLAPFPFDRVKEAESDTALLYQKDIKGCDAARPSTAMVLILAVTHTGFDESRVWTNYRKRAKV